jgi:hypothetical protein
LQLERDTKKEKIIIDAKKMQTSKADKFLDFKI